MAKSGKNQPCRAVFYADRIGKVEGELGCICPHCRRAVFFDTTHLSDLQGKRYRHNEIINRRSRQRCGGEFVVSIVATYDRNLLNRQPDQFGRIPL